MQQRGEPAVVNKLLFGDRQAAHPIITHPRGLPQAIHHQHAVPGFIIPEAFHHQPAVALLPGGVPDGAGRFPKPTVYAVPARPDQAEPAQANPPQQQPGANGRKEAGHSQDGSTCGFVPSKGFGRIIVQGINAPLGALGPISS